MSPRLAGQDACATRPGTRGCRQYAARGLTPIPPIHSIEGGTFRRHAKDAFHRSLKYEIHLGTRWNASLPRYIYVIPADLIRIHTNCYGPQFQL